jgi:hypothetical protein
MKTITNPHFDIVETMDFRGRPNASSAAVLSQITHNLRHKTVGQAIELFTHTSPATCDSLHEDIIAYGQLQGPAQVFEIKDDIINCHHHYLVVKQDPPKTQIAWNARQADMIRTASLTASRPKDVPPKFSVK